MIKLRMIQRKLPKRGRRFVNSRVETPYLVKIEKDPAKAWRRVYDVWANGRSQGWFIFQNENPLALSVTQCAQLESYQKDAE